MLRNFLWQGGKGNQKKFHLVNWDIVKKPLLDGGLQVRDLGLANLALGGKFLWKIFSNHRQLISHVFIKKYMHGLSLQDMEKGTTNKGKTLWKLCSHIWEFYKEQLYRIPGNGKTINLWEDKIMGVKSLNNVQDIAEMCDCLVSLGIKNLEDICYSDNDDNWLDWNFLCPPQPMRHQVPLLHAKLVGLAPI